MLIILPRNCHRADEYNGSSTLYCTLPTALQYVHDSELKIVGGNSESLFHVKDGRREWHEMPAKCLFSFLHLKLDFLNKSVSKHFMEVCTTGICLVFCRMLY